MQRIAYVKDIEAEIDALSATEDGGMRMPPAAPSRAATSGGARGGTAPAADGADGTENVDEAKKAEYEARKKEEDEFAKLEAAFIAELELKSAELPSYAQHLGVDAPERGKESKK